MAPNPQQIPSRTCGCPDCLIDLPPDRYGHRAEQDGCSGPWQARYRSPDGTLRKKNLRTRVDATQFLATVRQEAGTHAS